MRLFRHLFSPSAQSWLPAEAMARITAAIDAGELRHSGEICFAVEPALHWRHVLRGTTARERAEQAFAKLRVWDTEANTGVLLYVLLADHRLEIVADRGLRGVDPPAWEAVCRRIQDGLRSEDPASAIVHGIEAISDLLAEHAPQVAGRTDRDEIPNKPRFL
ncbi:putative membrane protein [Lysobacter dokdonensis DS-58]|uniref:Putative membrane protein n=1 Tax=Lysobacter dokdonensis DS-58 TaxID=1300345 RepID=A0A0A2WKV4_9GAMM|nr:TPM domain-containing protein [Lysobacter dokdonensis]KGQ18905.1 putative membrane protein [Lysobacter dokdonensis DS-58]